jgi:ribosomal protein S12 methylthiotransferase accessory factor YcaO
MTGQQAISRGDESSFSFAELVRFLKLTGRFTQLARRAAARPLFVGRPLAASPTNRLERGVQLPTPIELFGRYQNEWGWKTAEEVQVTLKDLGIGMEELSVELDAEASALEEVTDLVLDESSRFADALRVQLCIDGSTLVRELVRLKSFQRLAARARREDEALGPEELDAARRVLARLHATFQWTSTERALRAVGVDSPEVESFVIDLAHARRAGRAAMRALEGRSPGPRPTKESDRSSSRSRAAGRGETPRRKLDRAEQRILERGAAAAADRVGSYARLCRRERVIDPRVLAPATDRAFDEELELAWTRCTDLASRARFYVPTDELGRGGLAAGSGRDEAVLGALLRVIEGHAARMAELQLHFAGTRPPTEGFQFVELASAPRSIQSFIAGLVPAPVDLRVLDITSEVDVPTFEARIVDGRRPSSPVSYRGLGCHPEPELAIRRALERAALARARGERTVGADGVRADPALLLWCGSDPAQKSFSTLPGASSGDPRSALAWVVSRVRLAGFAHVLAAEIPAADLAPTVIARVLVPGVESTAQAPIGLRASVASIRDLLARN